MAPETCSLQRSVRKALGSERCVESLAGIACFVLGTLPANVLKPPLRLGLPNADLGKPTASKHGWLWGSEPRVELCLGWRCGVFHPRSSGFDPPPRGWKERGALLLWGSRAGLSALFAYPDAAMPTSIIFFFSQDNLDVSLGISDALCRDRAQNSCI